MEGSSLQLEVMRKVLELVVHERMSQGKGVKGFKEKDSAGLLHKITKPTAWRGGRNTNLEKGRRGCQAVGPL